MALPQLSASTQTSTETPAPQPPLHLLPKPGRPSLFSPERTAAICTIIEHEGISDSGAGALAGVTASTLARWKLEHEGFALELERARALFERAQVRAIREARKRDGTPDWRATAWLLKNSSPEGYGPLSRRRKLKPEGVHTDARIVGNCQSEGGEEQEHEHEHEHEVQSENCAILPETPREQDGGNAAHGPGEAEGRATNAAPAAQNHANLPETPGDGAREQASTGPRLSRRERRAEERRVAKARRVA
ncbi:MAG TPA: hypothetical protein VGO11_04390 [Chthoniobacteraceae bacterium]|jgi:hypothetical protein|nr:hypothetical protein [Chthoniobacteraceae bacterium]